MTSSIIQQIKQPLKEGKIPVIHFCDPRGWSKFEIWESKSILRYSDELYIKIFQGKKNATGFIAKDFDDFKKWFNDFPPKSS